MRLFKRSLMKNEILVFGEVLFDDFGDNVVLGGAPFNVAWHLQGFGFLGSSLLFERLSVQRVD